MKAQDFQTGDIIKIKSGGYGKGLFRVTAVNSDSIWFINNSDKSDITDFTLTDTNLDYYGDKVQIVSRDSREDAFRQVYAEKVLLADEETATKWHNALFKAMTELESNPTVKFVGGVLNFTSSASGKERFVTAHGCHKSCDCKGEISYHRAMFEILAHGKFTVKPKVVSMFQTCQLCYKPILKGDTHYACEREEKFYYEAA